MRGRKDQSLEMRVELLEGEIQTLREEMEGLRRQIARGEKKPEAGAQAPPLAAQIPPPPQKERTAGGSPAPVSDLTRNQNWINRIGIGLLLFGVAFLFKYSIDRGWITPEVRIIFGFLLGITLAAAGMRLYAAYRNYSQVLIGGGAAVLYITIFAAFHLYAFFPHALAFALMTVVTVLTFLLSLRCGEPPLSLIAALGGLGTPFLLHTGEGSVPALTVYACLVLCGAAAVYIARGWKSLLWTAFSGGWIVFLTAYYQITTGPALTEKIFLQGGILFLWLAFSLAPALAYIRTEPQAGGGRVYPPGFAEGGFVHFNVISTLIPFLGYLFAAVMWDMTERTGGITALILAAFYALLFLGLRTRVPDLRPARVHGYTAVTLLTISFILLLNRDALLITLSAEGLLLHLAGRYREEKTAAVAAHGLFAALALGVLGRLLDQPLSGIPVLNLQALAELAALCAALASGFFTRSERPRPFYLITAHVLFLIWIWREFITLQGGVATVSILWGLYAVGLLVYGMLADRPHLSRAGIGTLFLVVGKLFLYDLSKLSALWRVLLFLGFGAFLLGVGYYLQRKGSGGDSEGKAETP